MKENNNLLIFVNYFKRFCNKNVAYTASLTISIKSLITHSCRIKLNQVLSYNRLQFIQMNSTAPACVKF